MAEWDRQGYPTSKICRLCHMPRRTIAAGFLSCPECDECVYDYPPKE